MALDIFPPRRSDCDTEKVVEVWREDDTIVVGLYGEHDLSNAGELSLTFAKILYSASSGPLDEVDGSAGDVAVDLSQVTFLDSSTLHALIEGRKLVLGQARRFILRTPSLPAKRVLELSGLFYLVEPKEATNG